MTTLNDFTKEMLDVIEEATMTSLAKLGIHVSGVVLNIGKSRNGELYTRLKTSEFQTTPVIYKSVRVDGYGSLSDVENEKYKADSVYELNIRLSYRFDYFNGGENGVDIGVLKFSVFEYNDRRAIHFLGFTI